MVDEWLILSLLSVLRWAMRLSATAGQQPPSRARRGDMVGAETDHVSPLTALVPSSARVGSGACGETAVTRTRLAHKFVTVISTSGGELLEELLAAWWLSNRSHRPCEGKEQLRLRR